MFRAWVSQKWIKLRHFNIKSVAARVQLGVTMTFLQRVSIATLVLLTLSRAGAFVSNTPSYHQIGCLASWSQLWASNPKDTNRRDLFTQAAAGVVATATAATAPAKSAYAFNSKSRTKGYAVQKSDTEWQSLLSATQYDILRRGGTERPNSSVLEAEERPGIYGCAGCGTKLFDSKEKFHSGTGWPSFARALEGVEVEDVNLVTANMVGAEVRCGTCGGHLGDVFADGFLFVGTPAFLSGKRYCIDGAALVFQPSSGEAEVAGDKSPATKEQSMPDWLAPPKITAR